MSKVKLLLDVVEDLRSLADSVQAVADAMLQNEPTVDAEPKAPAPAPQKELTLEEVRAVLGEKSRAGFTAEIQALLKKYGAPKLSGIDPKHYMACGNPQVGSSAWADLLGGCRYRSRAQGGTPSAGQRVHHQPGECPVAH